MDSDALIPVLLGWLILSLLVGVYAANKGRSFGGFFVCSLLLSPLIAFIIAVVSAPNRDYVAAQSGMKKCPACAEYVQRDARICRFCRHSFETKKCPACASYNESDALFCRSCGQKFGAV